LLKNGLDYIPDPILKLQRYNQKYYLKYLKLKNILEYKDVTNMFKVFNSVFTKYEVESLLNGTYYFEKENDYKKIDNIEKMMLLDFQTYLADDILVKVDRASMGISLESREPLLDHKIIEFALNLPISYKQDKKILKDILSKYLPLELFERKKRGFSIPINNWLRNELKYLIDKYLDKKLIKEQNIFNERYIDELKYLFFQKKSNNRKIWIILMFQMWYIENMQI
jgi:asparagine synthase (glutamine-hydrolysing)